jgi:hypothetical protein
MKTRSLLLVLLVVLVATFVVLNFEEILRPTPLNLGLSTVQAPMGLVLVGLLAGVLLIFLLALLYFQTAHVMEVRRINRDVAEQRQLADKAEASRFTALQDYLQKELQAMVVRDSAASDKLHQKLDQVQKNLADVIEQTGNGLHASMGELEDRLEHPSQTPGDRA